MSYISVRYGGRWEGRQYKDGDEEFVRISSMEISFLDLLQEIHQFVAADVNLYNYVLHSMLTNPEGRKARTCIKNDDDLRAVLEVLTPHRFTLLLSNVIQEQVHVLYLPIRSVCKREVVLEINKDSCI